MPRRPKIASTPLETVLRDRHGRGGGRAALRRARGGADAGALPAVDAALAPAATVSADDCHPLGPARQGYGSTTAIDPFRAVLP